MTEERFADLAGGDPRIARVVARSLEQVATHSSSPVLREMAGSVLAGRIDLRTVARSDLYGAELGAGFQRFWSYYQSLDPVERERLIEQGRTHLASLPEDDGDSGDRSR